MIQMLSVWSEGAKLKDGFVLVVNNNRDFLKERKSEGFASRHTGLDSNEIFL